MKVSFKNVGQGDSILIEWTNLSGTLQVGIIDCNIYNGTNPVVDHLKKLEKFDLIFIILSHPHDDHFSGLPELLEYVEDKLKKVKYLLHTCFSRKEYLTASVKSNTSKKLLSQIFRKADQLHKIGVIENYCFVNDFSKELQLGESVFLKFLYPNHSLISEYNSRAFKNSSLLNNNPDANLLSTVIKIYSEKQFMLFTSDASKEVFWEINRKGFPELRGGKFSLGQVAHHGAEKNYYDTFWRSLTKNNSSTFACISVGANSYGHPSAKVVSSLNHHKYDVRLTQTKILSRANSISSSLNMVSTLISSSTSIASDLCFNVQNNTCILL